ncbi:MAG: polysaccharide deacetylase family protein [Niabella sp.]
MIVYTEHITPRLRYIVNFFSDVMSHEPWEITSDVHRFTEQSGTKINYSHHAIQIPCITIFPQGLLTEKGIRSQPIHCVANNGCTIFFTNNSDTGFDIFSAAFYLLSRYEEYLPHVKDKYGRYNHENSLAYKEGFLQKPIINIWIEQLKSVIKQQYPECSFKEKKYRFLPTYDIDMARSYQYKGWLRTIGSTAKDLALLRLTNILQRCQVVLGIKKDPFDTFDWLNTLHEQFNIKPYYFFLVAQNRNRHDKNITPTHPVMKQLITETAEKYRIGLHPSFRSKNNIELLQTEKKILEKLSGRGINASRQHYLRFSIPKTYRGLIENNIREEFSMGYSGYNGFRASVASPFTWYDLERETETPLIIYPFCFMEGASLFYQKHTPEQALEELTCLHTAAKNVNGLFSMIWHNSSLCNANEYKGWKTMYRTFIETVVAYT